MSANRGNGLSQILVYGIGRGVLTAIGLLNLRWARRIGRGIGRVLHLLDRRHREIALDNLLKAGMVRTPKEGEDLVRRMYEHLGICVAEIALTEPLLRKGRIEELVQIRGQENVETALSRGRGAVLAVAHLGNWEPAGVAYCARHRPIHSIYRPLDNRYFDRYLSRIRRLSGQVVIPKWNAAARMREVLLSNHLLGVLMDQDAGRDGVFVEFFGRPASTVKSAAILCLRYGSPAIPLNIYRENGRLWMVFSPPIFPEAVNGRTDRVRAMTQILTRRLEDFIRRHPEQWFWVHRRWKTQPSQTPGPPLPSSSKT